MELINWLGIWAFFILRRVMGGYGILISIKFNMVRLVVLTLQMWSHSTLSSIILSRMRVDTCLSCIMLMKLDCSGTLYQGTHKPSGFRLGQKISKERFSPLCCASVDGIYRLKLVVVGKSVYHQVLKDCMQDLPVRYFNSKKAWFTADIFSLFFPAFYS